MVVRALLRVNRLQMSREQYEIGSKDINKASGRAINSLAQALHCNFYDVMELDLQEE